MAAVVVVVVAVVVEVHRHGETETTRNRDTHTQIHTEIQGALLGPMSWQLSSGGLARAFARAIFVHVSGGYVARAYVLATIE